MIGSDVAEGDYFRPRVEAAARMSRFTESPIETMLGLALLELLDDGWELIPQYQWRGFRIDWCLRIPDKPLIFLEADGNEFHTKPHQIERDRRRDALIRRAGIRLWRFTGSEIYRNAEGCALRVYVEARK
jgi:very-short-patch-repair endonuclease